ncbi:MAG: hypothetical protein H7A01_02000 [Hahellaceae bacterium]|nr:hypothetical protein [Hahellaceae bacterium]MCP5212583.1 hypothetical protein [Hahellaceae bacterium]
MKRRPTKAEIRAMLEEQVDDYLQKGGDMQQVANGISGRHDPSAPIKPNFIAFDQPKEGRTPVPEVVAAIDLRKKPVKKPAPRRRSPKKRIIYDDFGEPLRWEWVEE